MFVPLDADIQKAVHSILSHPEHGKLVDPNAIVTDADPFVIATARVKGCAVVSSKKLMGGYSTKRTKIPNVSRFRNSPLIIS